MVKPLIYLASRSPRRRELLNQIGIEHKALAVAVDESQRAREAAEDYVIRLAVEKSRVGWSTLSPPNRYPVLAADTAVVLNGEIMGKPQNREDALRMLGLLSGRMHRVVTGVAITSDRIRTRLSASRVRFRYVSPGEAEAYWRSGEPADKAGGYAIQGLAAMFIAELNGSYSGVMGLPLFETSELLKEIGVDVLRHR